MGRPKAKLELTVEERAVLCRFARRRRAGAGLMMRAKIVLKCATGIDNQDVAEELGVSQDMVGKWRKRFVEKRLDGLLDAPRVGRPRSVTDDDVERIIDTTLHEQPRGSTHWSSRRLATHLGMS
jgi:transposase